MTQFREAGKEVTCAEHARAHGLPYSTFLYWQKRGARIDAGPEVKRFFESTAGVDFLHLLQVALHVCFTKVGTASIRNVTSFLGQTGLDQFVASSVGSQHALSRRIDEEIVSFGKYETQRMAAQMPEKQICVAQDETFHPDKMCLVVMDPVSNYIILECYAEKRDSETWSRLVDQALEGLPVKVVWQTSDEAKGLLHHTKVGLQAQHAPDLFHIQQEIVKGASRLLGIREQEARQRHREQMAKTPRSVGKLRAEPSAKAQVRQIKAGMELAIAYINRSRVQEGRQNISDAYHPYEIFSGVPQNAQSVSSKLEKAFKKIEISTSHLGERCLKRIAKAKRLTPEVAGTITQFFVLNKLMIEQAVFPRRFQEQLETALIPGFYLTEVARKEKCQKRSQAIADGATMLLLTFQQRAGPYADLTDVEYADLEKIARKCAGMFQRSSSCVEGRNAHLARYHRGFHRLSDLRLSALTVIHNYLIQRGDGTTAAERFFDNKHGNLFQWLVNRIDLPVRPHNRKKTELALVG